MVTWNGSSRDAEKWMNLRNVLEVDSVGFIMLVKGKGEV